MKKLFPALPGVVLGLAVALIPIEGLSGQARAALGVLLWAIVWWIMKITPDFVTAMLMSVLFITVCKVPAGVALEAFSGSSWWMLMSAFGLSYCVSQSGLVKRISLYVLRIFPATYRGQLLAQLIVGFVTAPFIPSMSAKSAMLTPLALGVSDSMGYGRKGKQATGLFLAMLTGLRNPGPLFISASVLGYAFLGQYPAELAVGYNMLYWFKAALPWFLFVSIVNFLALLLLFGPEKGFEMKAAAIRGEKPGPMSLKEKTMLVIILSVMALWVTEPLHGIPAYAVSITGFCAAFMSGVIGRDEMSTGLNWGSIIFIGAALGIASVFDYLGINAWVVEGCSAYMEYFAAKPWLLMLIICVTVVLLRFIIVSELALVNIIMVFLVPMAISHGISPWVIGFAVYAVINPWFFMYQNPVYMAAYYSVKGEMGSSRAISLYCFVYLVICTAGVLATLPWWQMMGIYSI